MFYEMKRKAFFKRLFDIIGASVGLCIFFIPMIVISLFILLRMGRPVFFSQDRPGKHNKIFKLYKFRTMLNTKDEQGILRSDAERLVGFGQFLRSTSLDELPGLLNVLKGDMSLVGPRPLLPEYLPFYTKEQAQRHLMKPGITGWAQINGRNNLSWSEKFSLDIWYVENQSFRLDLKIIFLTIKRVLQRDGISHGDSATMPRFDQMSRHLHEK
jgi:sugar transferase EpsL